MSEKRGKNRGPACETEKKPFPENLSSLMTSHKITQETLASAIGVKRQTISLYKTGQSTPDIEQLAKIAQYFNVSADWLLGLSNAQSRDESMQVACVTTGLSQMATEILVKLKENKYAPILSALFESPHFEKMIGQIFNALWCKKSASQRIRETIKARNPIVNNLLEEHNPAELAEQTLRAFSRYSDKFVIVPRSAQSASYLQEAQAEMLEAAKEAIQNIERNQSMDSVFAEVAKVELQAICDEDTNKASHNPK